MEEKKQTWEEQLKDETLWLRISVSLAIAIAIGFLAAIVFVCYPSGNDEKVTIHLAVVSTFGTALFALLTFSTVVWRGLVSARQADQQHEANNLKDAENISKLLQDGAALASNRNDSKAASGIAALGVVAARSNSEFSQTAMELLADFIIENIEKNGRGYLLSMATGAMERGSANYKARKILVVYCDESTIIIPTYPGFQAVEYRGGVFTWRDYVAIRKVGFAQFRNATFLGFPHERITMSFNECTFHSCRFATAGEFLLTRNKFEACDFSNTAFTISSGRLDDILKAFNANQSKCFYYENSPPTGINKIDSDKYLKVIPSPP